jgi:quinol monooxygenase YgiN
MTYGLFGTFIAEDRASDKLVDHLLDAAARLSNDPTCFQYIVGKSGDHEVAVFEVWKDEGAHDSSLQREDIRKVIQAARPLIAGLGGQTRLEIIGGKGIG